MIAPATTFATRRAWADGSYGAVRPAGPHRLGIARLRRRRGRTPASAMRRCSETRLKTDAQALGVEVGGLVEPLRVSETRAVRIFLKKLPLHHIAIDLVGGP